MPWTEVSFAVLKYISPANVITGGMGREDDDIKVDNVICRTPARNAQNLDAVKNEILEMVDRAVSFLFYEPSCSNTNAIVRILSTLLRLSASTASTIVSSLPDFPKSMVWSRSTIARSTSPALNRPVTR